MVDKILFLIRGLPGAGKSSLARTIWSEHVVFETDKYFIKDGVYTFDSSKLGEAHKWCKSKVEDAMHVNSKTPQHFPEIAVSNTFTQQWEMDEYFALASKYGYKVVSLIVENRHEGKSVHDVPPSTIEKMRKRFEIKL